MWQDGPLSGMGNWSNIFWYVVGWPFVTFEGQTFILEIFLPPPTRRLSIISYSASRWTGDSLWTRPGCQSGGKFDLPDPCICNLHATENFDQCVDDDDDGYTMPIYFGGPYIADDVLMRKLEARLIWEIPPVTLHYWILRWALWLSETSRLRVCAA